MWLKSTGAWFILAATVEESSSGFHKRMISRRVIPAGWVCPAPSGIMMLTSFIFEPDILNNDERLSVAEMLWITASIKEWASSPCRC
jgi:hypothetical protein